jgi:hypothetical protein
MEVVMMRRIAAAFAAVSLAVACGDADPLPEDDDTGVEVQSGDSVPAAGGQTALPPDDGAVRNVSATLTEWSVTLTQDSVPAGAIAFNVRNGGTMTHRFEVEGNGQEWATEDLAPGGDITMSVNLTPGTYEVYCPIVAGGVNHEERGMTTVLRVY